MLESVRAQIFHKFSFALSFWETWQKNQSFGNPLTDTSCTDSLLAKPAKNKEQIWEL